MNDRIIAARTANLRVQIAHLGRENERLAQENERLKRQLAIATGKVFNFAGTETLCPSIGGCS